MPKYEKDVKDWITVKGNHIPIKEGQTVEDAIAERFDYEDEEINLETEDLDHEVELVTTKYIQDGFGTISKSRYDVLKARGENGIHTEVTKTPIDKLPYARLKQHEDPKTAAKHVNPNFKSGDYEWTYNCQRCVVALEMRIRGYDVTAKPRLPDDQEFIFKHGSRWSESFEGFEWDTGMGYYPGDNASSANLVEREMLKAGEGARFLMSITWRKHSWQDKAGGHTLMGIVQDGQVIYYDPQTGKKANSWKYKCNPRETMFARIDHLHLTDKVDNCVYDKGKHPTVKSLTRGWLTKEEAEEGYETI